MDAVARPARAGAAPMLAYAVLACLFGWSFIIADQLGAGTGSGQFPLGPLIAAAVVSAGLGRAALRAWGRRLTTLRTGPGWYLLALLAPGVILAAAVLANAALGAPLPTGAQLAGWPELIVTFVVLLLFIGIGEEAGWTAFAAPWLLERHRFAMAWAILGTIRVLWHLPLMLSGNLPLTLGIGGNLAFQFIVLWLFQRSGGVWFLAALWHTMLNTIGGEFVFPMMEGAARARLGLLMTAGYVLFAVGILVVDRSFLRSRPVPAIP